MDELLKRLCELDPERFRLERLGEDDPYCVVHSGFAHGWRVGSRFQDEMHILMAVMEGIRAHGWNFIIYGYTPTKGWANAAVVWGNLDCRADGGTDAYNLASAYIEALQP